jgi:hypothetical protein
MLCLNQCRYYFTALLHGVFNMMMWKHATSYTLNVASLGTRWLAFGILFDHTGQLEGSDVSTNSNMELRYKKPLCLSRDIAQAWSFNSVCAFLRVEH